MQTNKVIWLTGLSGSGKTTLAKRLEEHLSCLTLDGDALRKVEGNTNFTPEGRFGNVRKAVDLCHANPKATIVVALISPFTEMREYYRRELGDRLFEVYVQCSLKTCIRRDVKGLYKRALSGEITDFTGISQPFEEPIRPELVVNTEFYPEDVSAHNIVTALELSFRRAKMREETEARFDLR